MATIPSTIGRRAAILAVLSLPLADVRVFGQNTSRGHLTIPLDQWKTVSVTFGGERIELTTAEIFAALKKGQ